MATFKTSPKIAARPQIKSVQKPIPRQVILPKRAQPVAKAPARPLIAPPLPSLPMQPRAVAPSQPTQPVNAGFDSYGFDRGLVDYLNNQQRMSYNDAGVSYNYDPATQTFKGYTMGGPVTMTLAQMQAEAQNYADMQTPLRSGGIPLPQGYDNVQTQRRSGGIPLPQTYDNVQTPTRSGGIPTPQGYLEMTGQAPRRSDGIPLPQAYDDMQTPRRSGGIPLPQAYANMQTPLRSGGIPNPQRFAEMNGQMPQQNSNPMFNPAYNAPDVNNPLFAGFSAPISDPYMPQPFTGINQPVGMNNVAPVLAQNTANYQMYGKQLPLGGNPMFNPMYNAPDVNNPLFAGYSAPMPNNMNQQGFVPMGGNNPQNTSYGSFGAIQQPMGGFGNIGSLLGKG